MGCTKHERPPPTVGLPRQSLGPMFACGERGGRSPSHLAHRKPRDMSKLRPGQLFKSPCTLRKQFGVEGRGLLTATLHKHARLGLTSNNTTGPHSTSQTSPFTPPAASLFYASSSTLHLHSPAAKRSPNGAYTFDPQSRLQASSCTLTFSVTCNVLRHGSQHVLPLASGHNFNTRLADFRSFDG